MSAPSPQSRVIVSARMACTPAEAFAAFVEDIGEWWEPNGLFRFTPRGPGALAFEPPGPDGRGGRLVERLAGGEVFEIGPVRDWRPGERLVVGWRQASFGPDHATEVEVRFEPVDGATRITVEHRGWESVPQAHAARHGFPLPIFLQHQGGHWRRLLQRLGQRGVHLPQGMSGRAGGTITPD